MRVTDPKEEGDHSLRSQILQIVREQPGVHILEIAHELGVTHPTILYYVEGLEREGSISSQLVGRRRVLFDSTLDLGPYERELLGILREPETLEILLEILRNAPTWSRKIHLATGIPFSTVKRQVQRLLSLGLPEGKRRGLRRELTVSEPFVQALQGLSAKVPPGSLRNEVKALQALLQRPARNRTRS